MKKNKEVLEQIRKKDPIFIMDITTGEMSIDLGWQRLYPNWKFKKVEKC
jgi:hypothetical protein